MHTKRHFSASFASLWFRSLLVALLLFLPACTWACSVPVFRYALEHWPPSPYELNVFHRGPLNETDQVLLSRFSGEPASQSRPANVIARRIDLASQPAPQMLALWQRQKLEHTPALVLSYYRGAPARGQIWSGPLTESNLVKLLDSPLRQRISQRLLRGDAAVWIFLESGDAAQDAAAAGLLEARLAHLQKTLQLPEPDPTDPQSATNKANPTTNSITFSLFRLARTHAAEEILIRMLLGSEEDLPQLKEPLAFPIFGRGRVLYALAGAGINTETIDEACSFLVGPCACIVKEENPGLDLLLATDWENLVEVTPAPEAPAPDLLGFTSGRLSNQVEPTIQGHSTNNAPSNSADSTSSSGWYFVSKLSLVGVGVLLFLVIGSIVVWQRSHSR